MGTEWDFLFLIFRQSMKIALNTNSILKSFATANETRIKLVVMTKWIYVSKIYA